MKKIIFDHIVNNQEDFVVFFGNKFPSFKATIEDTYASSEFQVFILYASLNEFASTHKEQVPYVNYFDRQILEYFKAVTKAIKHSSRLEIFKFLNIENDNLLLKDNKVEEFQGHLLPENFSNFPKGYKVVSFYATPASLLHKVYVLRKDAWRTEGGLYQRMIDYRKVASIRKYLLLNQKVFINNIIVTLASDTRIIDKKRNTVDHSKIVKVDPVTISLPREYDSIGIIDGQHRVFAYHEGGTHENDITKLRDKQNLLVTGIIYPENTTPEEKTKFEAGLFLDINTTQTGAKADLKQTIGLLLKPYSTESIGRSIIYRLGNQGPLDGILEQYSFDKKKLKTTSIVSYGLVPIVKFSGKDSFYNVWMHPNKEDLIQELNEDVRIEYIKFCTDIISAFLSAVKNRVGKDRWTIEKSVENKVLSVTTVNAFIICTRKIVEAGMRLDYDFFYDRLTTIDQYNFKAYKSSKYSAMGIDLFNKYFKP